MKKAIIVVVILILLYIIASVLITIENNKEIVTSTDIVASIKDGIIKVGDYIDYEKYIDGLSYEVHSGESGLDSVQIIKPNEGLWRVIEVDNENNQILITLCPDPSGEINYLQLCGINGYINGLNIIDDVCNINYSSEKLDTHARSITIEDACRFVNFDGKAYSNKKIKYGEEIEFISGEFLDGYKDKNGNIIKNSIKGGTIEKEIVSGINLIKASEQSPVTMTEDFFYFNTSICNPLMAEIFGMDWFWYASSSEMIIKEGEEIFGVFCIRAGNGTNTYVHYCFAQDKQPIDPGISQVKPIVALKGDLKIEKTSKKGEEKEYSNWVIKAEN